MWEEEDEGREEREEEEGEEGWRLLEPCFDDLEDFDEVDVDVDVEVEVEVEGKVFFFFCLPVLLGEELRLRLAIREKE